MEEKQKAKKKGKDIQLNAEFQRLARRDKKSFLDEQCREVEENNTIGKTIAQTMNSLLTNSD